MKRLLRGSALASTALAGCAQLKDAYQSADAGATQAEDRRFVERALKAEIVAAKYGFDESYPFRLQGDAQVEKALEMFPEAQKLSTLAESARRGRDIPPADAGMRAAQATPKTQ